MKYNCNKTQKKRLSKSGIAILAKNDHHIEGKIYVKETSLGRADKRSSCMSSGQSAAMR